jgi:hypothetical protein
MILGLVRVAPFIFMIFEGELISILGYFIYFTSIGMSLSVSGLEIARGDTGLIELSVPL